MWRLLQSAAVDFLPHIASRALRLGAISALSLLAGCGGFFTGRTDNGGGGTTSNFAYVANFNNGGASTVSSFSLNTTTGALTAVGSAASSGGQGAAALAVANHKFMYAANDDGNIGVFTFNSDGSISLAGQSASPGLNPDAIITDTSSQFLFVGNHGSPQFGISMFSINQSSGALAPVGGGTIATGDVTALDGPAGLAVSGSFLYAALDSAGIQVFKINADGTLTSLQLIAAPASALPQALVTDRNGRFLFVADQANDNVLIYNINSDGTLQGTPRTVATGVSPVAITVDPGNKFVFTGDQGTTGNDGTVSVFAILSDGSLSPLAGSPFAAKGQPAYIAVDPSGKFLYSTNVSGDNAISIFTLDTTGKLTLASSATAGANPVFIAFQ
jgi:6-phosphogluconolactonase